MKTVAHFVVTHLLPPRFYPPSAPPSLCRPTSLMRGEGHLAGGILVVVGNDDHEVVWLCECDHVWT